MIDDPNVVEQDDGQDGKEGEQHLYDVFVCCVSQAQVFLLGLSVIKNGSATEIDCTKSVIVSKFGLSLEIQASVLSWDTILPPRRRSAMSTSSMVPLVACLQ